MGSIEFIGKGKVYVNVTEILSEEISDLNLSLEHTSAQLICVGDGSTRKRLARDRVILNSLVSRNSIIADSVVYQPGLIVFPFVTIMPNVQIGKCCIIETGCIIDHDAILGDYVYLKSGTIVSRHGKVKSYTMTNYNDLI